MHTAHAEVGQGSRGRELPGRYQLGGQLKQMPSVLPAMLSISRGPEFVETVGNCAKSAVFLRPFYSLS